MCGNLIADRYLHYLKAINSLNLISHLNREQ